MLVHPTRLGAIVVNLLRLLLLVLLGRTAPQTTQRAQLLLPLLCASASADAAVLRWQLQQLQLGRLLLLLLRLLLQLLRRRLLLHPALPQHPVPAAAGPVAALLPLLLLSYA